MFDFSGSEILLIAVVALVVIGPKDLPRVLRTVGQWTGRARSIAREFQFQLDQMVRDSELDDVRKTMNAATSGDMDKTIRDLVDPAGEIEASVSTPEMLGETRSVPPTPSPDPAVPAPALALPAAPIEAPVLLQPVPVAPIPVEVGVEEHDAAAAPREPKSGTHG